MLFLGSYNSIAYMTSMPPEPQPVPEEVLPIISPSVPKPIDETSEQAAIVENATQNGEADTFILEDVILDTEFDTSIKELDKVKATYVKHRVSIDDLKRLAKKITYAYRQAGYLAAVAYVPEQEAQNGVVTIKVISGNFGDVVIDNKSKLDIKVINAIKENIRLGNAVEGKHIENVLYRINALGGVKATGKLERIKNSGDIRLVITVIDDKRTRDVVYSENNGSENTGRYRFGIVHNSYNIDNQGANLEVGVLFSNKNLRNYHVDFNILSDRKSASRMGVSFGRTTYSLGNEYSSLDAKGTSNDISVYGKSTLFQSNDNEVNVSYGYRYRKISDEIGAFKLSTDKHSHSVYGEVSGYNRVPNGVVNYKAKITAGKLGNDSEYAKYLNTFNRTEGNFLKFNGKVDYLQGLSKKWQFHTTLSWQIANKSLDSSEKMFLGGFNGVRAYSSGDGSGDKGYLSRTELIYQTDVKGLSLNAFFDMGASGNKSKSLNTMRGYGVGINYSKSNDFFVQLSYARKIGFNENVSSDKGKGKIWFLCGKVF